MFNAQWDILFVYLSAQQDIFQKFAAVDFDQQIALVAPNDEEVLPTSFVNLADLQLELVNNLQICRDTLATLLDADNCRYVIDALVFHCDEMVLTQKLSAVHIQQDTLEHLSRASAQLKLSAHWSKLQTQFSQCNHGGEMFFSNLDSLLSEPEHHLFCIEVHYFCLKQGFVGRFLAQQHVIEEYQQRCIKVLQAHTRLSQLNSNKHPKKSEPLFGVSHAASI